MKNTLALLASTAAIATASNPLAIRQASDQTCYDGVYIVVARASTESPGTGIIGSVAENVTSQVPNSHIVPVVYPATLANYFNSEGQGVAGMTKLVESYIDACPDGRVVIMGYSQGAAVVGDTLCGTSSAGQKSTEPLPEKYGKNIVAAVGMGDPNFVPGKPWDRGTNTEKSGSFPRQNFTACQQYVGRYLDYCDTNDVFCASGDSLNVHYLYTFHYGANATDFIVNQVQNYKVPASGGSSSSSSGSMPTSSSGSGLGSATPTSSSGSGSAGGSSGSGTMGGAQATATGAAAQSIKSGLSVASLFGVSLAFSLCM